MTEATPELSIRWCAGCRQAVPRTEFQKSSRRCRECMRLQVQRRRAVNYDAEIESQGGVCALCRKPPMRHGQRHRLVVDHDYDTGNFRGLICDRCNLLLGYADDDQGRLLAAIEYLKRPGRPLDLQPLRRRNVPRYPVTVTYRAPRTPVPQVLAPRFLAPGAG